MGWCFATVNNRLAEIYFDRKKSGRVKIRGHCYVKKAEYKTKQEQKWIKEDTAHVKVAYKNKRYTLRLLNPKS